MKNKKINEATSDSSGGRGSYISPLVPGFRDFEKNILSPFTEPVSHYDDSELAYDSYDGKMDTPKNLRKKMETKARKISKYIKNHPRLNDDDGDNINATPGKGNPFVPIKEWVEINDEIINEDLGVWFGTKKKPKGSKQPKGPWVNICKKVDGKHPPCGRPEATDKAYPKCRAAGVAGKMSDSEKRNACQQKRRAEKTHPKSGTGNEPKMVSHKKRTNESLIRKYILLEKRIGQLVSNMEVVFAFDLITTKHSDDRGMGRSIENYDDRPVSNREILEVFNLFKEDIAEKIIEGEIYDQKEFIIVSNKWGLSIPLVAVREDYGTYWKFIVKTVFRSTSELRLRTGKDQLILEK